MQVYFYLMGMDMFRQENWKQTLIPPILYIAPEVVPSSTHG